MSGRRSGAAAPQHRVDGGGEVLDGQERPPGAQAAEGQAASGERASSTSAAMLPFTPGP